MITIIISAYNAENTIKKAIESCLNQTYKDLEIIVVNDCSTDGTCDIVKSFTDKRVKLTSNKENLGAGMSRRIGTKLAKGEYTLFLDSDDWLDTDMIDTLYSKAKEYDADIVSSGIRFINGDSSYIFTYDNEEVKIGKDELNSHLTIKRYLVNKLIRRSLWDSVEYSDRRFIEDTQTCFYLVYLSDKVVNIPYTGYNYYQNPTSLCHTTSQLKQQIYSCLASKDMCDFVKKHSTEQDFYDSLRGFMFHVNNLLNIVGDKLENYTEEMNELLTFIKDNEYATYIPCEILVSEKDKIVYCMSYNDEYLPIMKSILKNDFNEETYSQIIGDGHKISRFILNPYHFDREKYEGYKKMIVLKNPMDRFMSYLNKCLAESRYDKFFDKDVSKSEFVDSVINKYSINKYIDRNAVVQSVYVSQFDFLFGDDLEAVDFNDFPKYYKILTNKELIGFDSNTNKYIDYNDLNDKQISEINDIIKNDISLE